MDIVKQHITSKAQRDALSRAQTMWLHSSELLPSANNLVKKRTTKSRYHPSLLLFIFPPSPPHSTLFAFPSFASDFYLSLVTSCLTIIYSVLKDVMLEFNTWFKLDSSSNSNKKTKGKNKNSNNNNSNTNNDIEDAIDSCSNNWGNSEFVMLLSLLLNEVEAKPTRRRTQSTYL